LSLITNLLFSNDLDIGLAAGANFTFKSFSIDFRYTFSLQTIVKEINETGAVSTKPDVKNAVISILIGYSLPL
jgi:hypothetical protein